MNKREMGLGQWVIIALVGYLIVITLLYILLLRPTFNRLNEVKIEASTAEEHFLLDSARQAVNTFRGRLVKADEINSVRSEIMNLGQKSNVTSLSVEPLPSEEDIGRGLVKIPIKVQLQGGYHNIGTFINNLESSEKLSFVGNLDIQNQTGMEQKHKAEFMLYVFKPAK